MQRGALEFETMVKLFLVLLVVLALALLALPRITTLGKAILKLLGV